MEINKFSRFTFQAKVLIKSLTLSDLFWLVAGLLLVSYKLWMPLPKSRSIPPSERFPADIGRYDTIDVPRSPIHEAMKGLK